MITTTLNKIRKHTPCEDGWIDLLKHLGKTKADDEVLKFSTRSPNDKWSCNAHLIAAAPELLEACKEVLLQFSSTPKMGADNDYGDPCYTSSHDKMMGVALTQVQAAIAKAEGKS